jgi:predicted permease
MLGRRSQDDFEDEIHAHIQMEIDRLMKQGMSREDAERVAKKTFGNAAAAGDRFQDGQPLAWLDDFWRDMRLAWRSLLRAPGFLIASVGTLTLAIGAVAGMFNVVDQVMLKPLPYAQPDRLVFIQGTAPGSDLPERYDLGDEWYVHYKENAKTIDKLFIFSGGTSTFRANDRVERIPMAWPTNDMYATFGVRPQLGRLPVETDNDDAVVISDQMWSSWFGRDPAIIGKWYFVSDSLKQVIGVMPADFKFPSDKTMLWVSNTVRASAVRPGNLGQPVIARLKPGVTIDQAAVELTSLAKGLPARFGELASYQKIIDKHRTVVTPALDAIVGPTLRTSLLVLLAAVALVLLIACANVANLFLVRAEARRRDLTVRRAIGASQAQLVRFQMAEAFVIALTAGVLALLLAAVTLPLFLKAAPEGIPRLSEVGLDLPTLATTFGLVILVALACGAAPAMRAASPDLSALREGGRGATGRHRWGRDLLVAGQTALALVLLIGSALLVESFQRLRHVNPGYDVSNIYTFQFAPEQPNLRNGPQLGQLHLNVMDRLRAMPGVSSVGVVNNIPLDEGTSGVRVRTDEMAADAQPALIRMNFTGGDYFKAASIPTLQGRTFTREEATTPNNSVLLSRSAAEKLFPGQSALGKRLRPSFGRQDSLVFSVVGIVGDVKQNDWRENGQEAIYFPLTGPTASAWGMGSPAYVVKSTRAESMKNEVRALIKEFAPEAPVYREFTWEFLAKRSMLQLSFTMLTLGVVSALALILGAVGLYGVLSYVVAQRTREIGVRMALGATAQAVRRQVVSQGTKVVAAGVVVGIVAALASTKYLATLLFGVKAVDLTVYAAMSVMMIGVGILSSYMPARRASNVDPIVALRQD